MRSKNCQNGKKQFGIIGEQQKRTGMNMATYLSLGEKFYIYVRMHVCMYTGMNACMYICMAVCTYA